MMIGFRARVLSDMLDERGIDHQFVVPTGDHDGGYWGRMVPEYLRFYDVALNPERP